MIYFNLSVVLMGLALIVFNVQVVTGQTWNDSVQLMQVLKRSYDKNHRPVLDQTKHVVVNVSMYLTYVQDIDEVAGKLSMSAYIGLTWFDEILRWDNSYPGHIASLMFPKADLWIPPLTLSNSYSRMTKLGMEDDQLRVYPSGMVTYFTTDVFESLCEVDVTNYPYDTQNCDLTFSTSPYTDSEIHIISTFDKIMTPYNTENGEWTLAASHAFAWKTDGNSNNMVFLVKLKRKPGYIAINVILPIVLMSFINLFVFILPSDSGERIGYSVTLLLAISVFLTLVGDNLPKISEPLPILGTFLVTTLIESVLICFMTTLSLYLYHKNVYSTPPAWIQKILNIKVFKLCCHDLSRTSSVAKIKPCNKTINTHLPTNFETENSTAKSNRERVPYEKTESIHLPANAKAENSTDSSDRVSWKDVSRALDSLCLVVFLIASLAVNGHYLMSLKNGQRQ